MNATAEPVPLSVLDLSPIADGETAGDALRHTTALARRAEELRYRRFWVPEHHSPAIACSSPAVVSAHLAAVTSTIRVGSGGVMLPNHVPLVVAEQFGTLEALHPGRIDLGIGRSTGTDQVTARELRRSAEPSTPDTFARELADLIGYFTGEGARREITATPGRGHEPAIWLLGSGESGARLAGQLGLPLAFAHHLNAANTTQALTLYRDHFRPSRWLHRPCVMLSVNTICADTDERAERLAAQGLLSFLRSRPGSLAPDADPANAPADARAEAERQFARTRWAGQALGGPETVHRQLGDLLRRTGADELMLLTVVYDIDDRIRSFELIAEKSGALLH